jgi:hypothetical protein
MVLCFYTVRILHTSATYSGNGAYWSSMFNVRVNTAPCVRDLIEEMMHDVGRVFDDLGVWWVAEGGTALGAVRQGGMIPYDYDGDILVDSSLTVGKWREAMERLIAEGYEDYSANPLKWANTTECWNANKPFETGVGFVDWAFGLQAAAEAAINVTGSDKEGRCWTHRYVSPD